MADMGILEWALLFDKITWVDYLIIHGALFVVFGVALLIAIKKDWI